MMLLEQPSQFPDLSLSGNLWVDKRQTVSVRKPKNNSEPHKINSKSEPTFDNI